MSEKIVTAPNQDYSFPAISVDPSLLELYVNSLAK